MTVYMKDWFFNKMQAENRNIKLWYGACEVIRETEKAYLLSVEYASLDGEFGGTKNIWCPKSCTMTAAEFEEAKAEKQERFEAGCQRYEKLVNFAKSQIKGIRVGMKAETILKKLAANGISYAY